MIQLKPKGIEVYQLSIANSEYGTPRMAPEVAKFQQVTVSGVQVNKNKVTDLSMSTSKLAQTSETQKIGSV